MTASPHRVTLDDQVQCSGEVLVQEVGGEAVLLELERRGVITSSGSACAAGSDEPSHVLVACGVEPEVAQTSVRFTFGHAHRSDLTAVADAVAASIAAVRSGA